MTPGNPTDTRSNRGHIPASFSITAMTLAGVALDGVGIRWRSCSGLPSAERVVAFIPVPPISTAKVRISRGFLAAGFATASDGFGIGILVEGCARLKSRPDTLKRT